MTKHLSLRLAWHDNGWNGQICNDPEANVYCVGQHSYPRGMIAEGRDLEWECKEGVKGCPFLKSGKIPPCIYSINAFGKESLKAYAEPPAWFKSGDTKFWDLLPATACIWPYEGMYSDDVNNASGSQQYDYNKRLENAKEYFAHFEPSKSLVIYYSNYSNPLNQGEENRYVIVGISRLKQLGEVMYYENTDDQVKEKYAGGFVWQMPVTSNYPDEGFRLPISKYLNNPEVLERIAYNPEDERKFKYATRELGDDDALEIVEHFLKIVDYLISIEDKSENWTERKQWLEKLVSELWESRGIYPGMANIANYLEFQDAIPLIKVATLTGKEEEFKQQFFDFIKSKTNNLEGLAYSEEQIHDLQRSWKLKSEEEKVILEDVFPKFTLTKEQIERIVSKDRSNNNISSTLADIIKNPYIICEEYIGEDVDDRISFNKIDHGMLPSPDLGAYKAIKKDDQRRFRALCVEALQYQTTDTFTEAEVILDSINIALESFPDWKRTEFPMALFEVDADFIKQQITIRDKENKKYLYLNNVYQDERTIETELKNLVKRNDIRLSKPVLDEKWRSYLENTNSSIAKNKPDEYQKILDGQVEICKQVFQKPVCVVMGSAGTGKTTIIKALINAIENVHGTGTTFRLLAPTGKAADRIREQTGKTAATMHSFLSQKGWLNDNFTYKYTGGKQEEGVNTYIIDEASMVDLSLMAAVFRAVDFNTLQRIIFVGDPNQLPPIGKGKVFADVIDWLTKVAPGNIGKLTENVRQKQNSIDQTGTSILDLAEMYIRKKDEKAKFEAEDMLQKIQMGGEVDKDLSVYFWKDSEELEAQLKGRILNDLESDAGVKFDSKKSWEFQNAVFNKNQKVTPASFQIISPYRGELFGTENINLLIQKLINGWNYENHGEVGSVAYGDKVIQVMNRANRNAIYAYDCAQKKTAKVNIFNGELGIVKVHGFDKDKVHWPKYRIKRFQVTFNNKDGIWVNYDGASEVENNLELAYAISVHKAQGSEFERLYLILPKSKKNLLSMELMYTAITRAKRHLTIFAEEDVSVFQSLRRYENSHLIRINSSLMDFAPIPKALHDDVGWYEEGKIHSTLTEYMVRSKSEVIIANMLAERKIPFKYEQLVYSNDGMMYLPDFTITVKGETYFWEHLGMLDKPSYRKSWEKKKAWYEKNFPDMLITTEEGPDFTKQVEKIITEKLI